MSGRPGVSTAVRLFGFAVQAADLDVDVAELSCRVVAGATLAPALSERLAEFAVWYRARPVLDLLAAPVPDRRLLVDTVVAMVPPDPPVVLVKECRDPVVPADGFSDPWSWAKADWQARVRAAVGSGVDAALAELAVLRSATHEEVVVFSSESASVFVNAVEARRLVSAYGSTVLSPSGQRCVVVRSHPAVCRALRGGFPSPAWLGDVPDDLVRTFIGLWALTGGTVVAAEDALVTARAVLL